MTALFFLAFSEGWAKDPWQAIKDPKEIFQTGVIQVIGSSEKGQSRYRAIRAAEVVAQRSLLEILEGLRLYGTTRMKEKVTRSEVSGFLRGAVKCGQTYDTDQRVARVCMRLNLREAGGLYDRILPLLRKQQFWPQEKQPFTPLSPKGKEKTQSALTAFYDGLILDAREFEFRPALLNRIITDMKDVVFDPSRVPDSVLIERGCGGYSTTLDKAKAMLSYWGSRNPLTMKCSGVMEFTDAQITRDNGEVLFLHDRKSGLLARSRVVYLLK